jgi:L-alanine-DL-glutamate epimerase-like enolase superfamily enzyme
VPYRSRSSPSTFPYAHGHEQYAHRSVKEPLKIVDWQALIPTSPGLGIELDVDAIAAHPATRRDL